MGIDVISYFDVVLLALSPNQKTGRPSKKAPKQKKDEGNACTFSSHDYLAILT